VTILVQLSKHQIVFELLLIGQVAFITGGWSGVSSVELYSPNGDCQHQLAPLPVDLMYHVLEKYGNTIIACAGLLIVPFVDIYLFSF
jgi:hypothetical protein